MNKNNTLDTTCYRLREWNYELREKFSVTTLKFQWVCADKQKDSCKKIQKFFARTLKFGVLLPIYNTWT